MQISTEVIVAVGGGAFTILSAVVTWVFNNVIKNGKEITVLGTKLSSTDEQVKDIKEDIKELKDDLTKHSQEQRNFMIQLLETISSINTNVARLEEKANRD